LTTFFHGSGCCVYDPIVQNGNPFFFIPGGAEVTVRSMQSATAPFETAYGIIRPLPLRIWIIFLTIAFGNTRIDLD
jgi:hypothetical protein